MKKIFKLCKRYLFMYKWRLFLYILISITVSMTGLVSPYIIGDFIDQLMTAEGIGFIYRYFIFFAVINGVSLVLGYVSGRLYVWLQTRLGYRFNRDFIQKLTKVPLKYTDKQDTAYLNQRINNDTNGLIIFCIGIVQSILVNGAVVVVTVGLMFYFHPLLAVILLGVAGVYFVLYSLYKGILYRASFAFQEAQSGFFAKLHEQLFNIRFVKLHSLFTRFTERLNHSFDALLFTALRQQRASYIFSGLDRLVTVVAQIILLFFGGREIIAGRLTIGRFIIISSYFNLMLGSLRYFFGLGQVVQNNLVFYDRLQALAQIKEEPNGTRTLDAVNTIAFKNVSFGYNENTVLNHKNLFFERGKLYAVKGPNGACKSTLADILLGLQAGEYTGEVLYNGISINELDMYDVRRYLVGITEQEPMLLADTLAYNLHPGDALDKSRDDFIRLLNLEGFIQSLPNGLDTVVNENAVNLSGGEKQKISLLRALLKDPDVLLLDEPTSALDADSKVRFIEHLHKIKGEKIIIMITHEDVGVDEVVWV